MWVCSLAREQTVLLAEVLEIGAQQCTYGRQLMTLALMPRMLFRQCSLCGKPTSLSQQPASSRAARAVLFADLTFSTCWRSYGAKSHNIAVNASACPPAARFTRWELSCLGHN